MSLLNCLLWDCEFERVPQQSSPTSPSSPSKLAFRSGIVEPPSLPYLSCDYYESRAHAVVDAIRETGAPEGLIVWLNEHHPFLHRWLAVDLPDGISRAWISRVSRGEFETLCAEVVDTYHFAAELYVNSKKTRNRAERD